MASENESGDNTAPAPAEPTRSSAGKAKTKRVTKPRAPRKKTAKTTKAAKAADDSQSELPLPREERAVASKASSKKETTEATESAKKAEAPEATAKKEPEKPAAKEADRPASEASESQSSPDRSTAQRNSGSGSNGSGSHQSGNRSGGGGQGNQFQNRSQHGHDNHGNRGGQFQKKFNKKNKKGRKGGGGGGGWTQPVPRPELAPVVGNLPDVSALSNLEEMAERAASLAEGSEILYLDEIYTAPHAQLLAACRDRSVDLEPNPGRVQLIKALLRWASENSHAIIDRGILDLQDDGQGFVVHSANNFKMLPESTFVPPILAKRYGLKRGHEIEVQVRAPVDNERCGAALTVRSVMGIEPDEAAKTVPFEDLVPYYPLERIFLELPGEGTARDVSMRAFDILTPIGLGQRGLIVAPPRTGKTILLQGLANSIAKNVPQAHLIILLIDERPEEVTDFRRHFQGEVVSSTFDEDPESHVHAAEVVIEKARRAVEMGRHVVILLDSITRLARAYNALASNSGKIMSGGLEATALQKPKRFFGAARNIEGSGSLTIMGTALVETGSRMDEVIFEEFKGTGNMEVHLDRDLVNKRIFPAINFERSGTRKEELLYHPEEMARIYSLRRAMQGIPPVEAMEMLIQRLKKTKTNAEFLMTLNR